MKYDSEIVTAQHKNERLEISNWNPITKPDFHVIRVNIITHMNYTVKLTETFGTMCLFCSSNITIDCLLVG